MHNLQAISNALKSDNYLPSKASHNAKYLTLYTTVHTHINIFFFVSCDRSQTVVGRVRLGSGVAVKGCGCVCVVGVL